MSKSNPDWTKNEFLGYLFLYCANADYVEKEAEKEFILSKIDLEVFKKMHVEFDRDKDYQRIEKILSSAEEHYPSDEGKEKLVGEIKALFLSDGEFDILERNIFIGLKHLLEG